MSSGVFSSRMDMTGCSLVCGQYQCFPDIADSKAFDPSQEANTLACQFPQRCCATLIAAETSGGPWQSLSKSVQLHDAARCQGTKQLTSLAVLPSCLQQHGIERLARSRNKSKKADLGDRWNCCCVKFSSNKQSAVRSSFYS